MKKLKIVFKDNSKITYTIKDHVDYVKYFDRHSKKDMQSAVLQKYPLKNNEPIDLLKGERAIKTMHMSADIRGMLRNHSKKGSLKGVFTDKKGRYLSDEEARKYLNDCLAKGWKVIPMGDCDNFDYQTGCKGHST